MQHKLLYIPHSKQDKNIQGRMKKPNS